MVCQGFRSTEWQGDPRSLGKRVYPGGKCVDCRFDSDPVHQSSSCDSAEVTMEAELLKEPKSEPKKEPNVLVCGYCNSWCYQGEYLHHDSSCQRPDQHN
jgi:hypothetical protein